MVNVYGPFTDILRGSQPLSSVIPWTSVNVTKSPSSRPCRVSSKQVTRPSLSYSPINICRFLRQWLIPHLVYRDNHATQRLFTCGIHTCKLAPEVVEHRTMWNKDRKNFQSNSDAPEQSVYFGRYKGDAVLVRPIIDFKLFGEWNSTQDDDLTGMRTCQSI